MRQNISATRIMIIGGPGSGKSWLAYRLSKILNITVYCVDDAVHDEDGLLRTNAEIDHTVRSWISNQQWIIEGGNSRTYSERAAKATVLIYMSPPRWLRVCRILVRDRLNFSLIYWSWKYDEIFGIKDQTVFEHCGDDIAKYKIKTKKDAAELLKLMTHDRCSPCCE